MRHPLFNPFKNFYFFLIAWAEIMIAHAMIILFYSETPLILAIVDSLLFNLSFAAFSLGIWYAVRFLKIGRDKRNKVFFNHITAICIFLTVWISFGTFVMGMLSDADSDHQYLKNSIPFRFLSGLLYYLVIVFFYYSYSYYLSSRENLIKAAELKAIVKETQLELLKSQMNPHFIFNSLNSISALTIIDPSKAREMIIRLSSFLRYSLSQKPDQLIPFSQEMDNGLIYLSIEKMRFGDRLIIESSMEETIKDVPVPGMILQPVLENAVKHGAYESLEPVRISIVARREKEYLSILICNNYEVAGNASGKGLGIRNLKEKMKLMYGSNARVILINENNLFQVTLYIPVTAKNHA